MSESIQRWGIGDSLDLARARDRLLARLRTLEARLEADPENEASWLAWSAGLDLLLRLEDRLALREGNACAVLTSKEMAGRLGISVKTLLARKKRGAIRPSVSHGKALGWRLRDAIR